MKDGDIYFWGYKTYESSREWCKSGKAVVVNGTLIDTYWHSGDNKIVPLAHPELVLEFRANKSDLKEIKSWDIWYYDEEDIVDMRHANNSSGPIYLKKSAVRSKERMLEYANYQLEQEKSKMRTAEQYIQKWKETISEIESGDIEKVLL